MALTEHIREYLSVWGAEPEGRRRRREFPAEVPPVAGGGPLPPPAEPHWRVHISETRRYLRTIPQWATPVAPHDDDEVLGFAGEAHCSFALERRYQFDWRSAYLWVAHDDHPAEAALYRWRCPPSAIAVFNSEHPDRPQLAQTYDKLRRQVGEALLHSRRQRFEKLPRGDREPLWRLESMSAGADARPARFDKRAYVTRDLTQGTVPTRVARLLERVEHPLTRTEILWTLFAAVELAAEPISP